jgi:hypothetical protein
MPRLLALVIALAFALTSANPVLAQQKDPATKTDKPAAATKDKPAAAKKEPLDINTPGGRVEDATGHRRRLRQEDRGRLAVQGEGRAGAEESRAAGHVRGQP